MTTEQLRQHIQSLEQATGPATRAAVAPTLAALRAELGRRGSVTRPGRWVRAHRLQMLAQRLCDAPDLTGQGADLMVRLDRAALDLIGATPR